MSSKSSNSKSKQYGDVNRAEQSRQEKQKKIDDNNIKVSKQLEKSANSWQNSMEQVRKIAKKSQDSSQIMDNVFTENEYDRSEMDFDQQRNETKSNISDRPFIINDPSFRPTSQYANTSNPFSEFLRTRMESGFNPGPRFQQLQPKGFLESPNRINYNYPTFQGYSNQFMFPPNSSQYNNQSYNSFTSNMKPLNPVSYNQNFNHPFVRPNNRFHNPGLMFPNFYQSSLPYNGNMIPCRPPQQCREDNSSFETMKVYVTSLLEKLELLNDTVRKLKQNKQGNSHHNLHCQSKVSRPPSRTSVCSHIPAASPSHCYCHPQSLHRRRLSCSCMDLQRPSSSISQRSPAHTEVCNHAEHTSARPYSYGSTTSCSNLDIRGSIPTCSHHSKSQSQLHCHEYTPSDSRMSHTTRNVPRSHINTVNCHYSHQGFQDHQTRQIYSQHNQNGRSDREGTTTKSNYFQPHPSQPGRPQMITRDLTPVNVVDTSTSYPISKVHNIYDNSAGFVNPRDYVEH